MGGRYVPVARCLAAGLRFRDRRSWTVPTGHQDPSRQARRCHAGGVTEGVFVGRIEGSRKNRLGVLQTPKRFLTE